ncbi:cation diffusion facilitator family transporter [Pannus brasiliensis CCIBt3594]|uniref:Cation diffusion facilitator family transporter n=1 Tax=Pannus brasiliensis CCIBt3594 TaxID=1427578 RepID=A0AAW9R019_9CHRO
MAEGSSHKTIFAAIAANLAIAITKFIAATMTGSSAMLSEGIHSVVDTSNELVLLYGIHRGQRPPDTEHPFGHGRELYFWTLIVAILIFAIGGGMSIYEGITHLIRPSPIENPTWNYIVLGLAFVFEGFSWTVALREFIPSVGDRSLWQAVRASKDPTIFTVLFEDSAALLGLIVAFLGIFLGHSLENPWFDGGASIIIGSILILVAIILARESKSLLVGEGVDAATARHLRSLVLADPSVDNVLRLLTLYFSPHEILLNIEIQFRRNLTIEEVVQAIDRIEFIIQRHYPDIRDIFVEAESLTRRERSGQEVGGEDG